MATFRAIAVPATFIDAGTHRMVSAHIGAGAFAYETFEARNVDGVAAYVADVAARLKAEGRSFSLNARCIAGRKPAGFDAAAHRFRVDYDAETGR